MDIDFQRTLLDGAAQAAPPPNGFARSMGITGVGLLLAASLFVHMVVDADADADAAQSDAASMAAAAPLAVNDVAAQPAAAVALHAAQWPQLLHALEAAVPAAGHIERLEVNADDGQVRLHMRAADMDGARALAENLARNPLWFGLHLVQHDPEAGIDTGNGVRGLQQFIFEGRVGGER